MNEALREKSIIKADRKERLILAITASCSVALTGGMAASLIYLLLALVSPAAGRPAFAQPGPLGAGIQLQAGIEKEEVDGDLKAAMDIYQKIAADQTASRDVCAKALLRLAGCDEKLGREFKQVYVQIVRNYPDLPPASQARKRLAQIRQQEHPRPSAGTPVSKTE
jgi:hypothetical protein